MAVVCHNAQSLQSYFPFLQWTSAGHGVGYGVWLYGREKVYGSVRCKLIGEFYFFCWCGKNSRWFYHAGLGNIRILDAVCCCLSFFSSVAFVFVVVEQNSTTQC